MQTELEAGAGDDPLRCDVGDDGIALVRIDVANRTTNVITERFAACLSGLIDRLAADVGLKGIVITSAKKDFLTGADLKDVATWLERGTSLADAFAFSARVSAAFRRLETCGKPVVAAMNGAALGGGFELALACHFRILADVPGAVVGLPEVNVGLMPGAGGTQRLPRLAGIARALPLLLEGRSLRPAQALELGIVDAVVEPARLLECAREWLVGPATATQPWDRKGFLVPGGAGLHCAEVAQRFAVATAQLSRAPGRNSGAPLAILSAVYEGTVLPIDRALDVESACFARLAVDPVARNLIRTGFVNKGLADRLARRPDGVPPSRVARVGVLGAGMMGSGIALASARAGIDVVLLDTSVDRAVAGRSYAADACRADVERGRSSEAAATAIVARITTTAEYADLAGCDLIVESVFEKRETKDDAIRRAEAAVASTCLLATNTSTLPITGLARSTRRPADFIGLHFFSPAERMPLVEVIVGKRTSRVALARALDFVAQLRKTPIVVNDSRGFYTSRVFRTYCREGMCMLDEGIAPALIENAARQAGMPVGPLAVADEVSIELLYKLAKQEEADLGERYVPDVGYEVVRRFVEDLERPGKRFGAGFYEYPADGRKRLWPKLAQIFPQQANQPDAAELKQRFLTIQALETARCFEERVVEHPADADLGSLYGWSYPAWTGGTLSYIDMIGIEEFVARCQRFTRLYGPRFKPSAWLRARARERRGFHSATTPPAARAAGGRADFAEESQP